MRELSSVDISVKDFVMYNVKSSTIMIRRKDSFILVRSLSGKNYHVVILNKLNAGEILISSMINRGVIKSSLYHFFAVIKRKWSVAKAAPNNLSRMDAILNVTRLSNVVILALINVKTASKSYSMVSVRKNVDEIYFVIIIVRHFAVIVLLVSSNVLSNALILSA